MEKITNFKNIVKANRKLLKSHGIAPSTIHSYENGVYPSMARAIRLAEILGVDLEVIPYYRVIRK